MNDVCSQRGVSRDRTYLHSGHHGESGADGMSVESRLLPRRRRVSFLDSWQDPEVAPLTGRFRRVGMEIVFEHRRRGHSLPVRLLVALAILAAPSSPSKADDYSFAERCRWGHFTTEDGLPSNRVTEIVEAHDGTTWVSTSSGVAWFDGYRWHQPGPREGLPGGSLEDITASTGSGIMVVLEGRLYRGDRNGFLRVPLVVKGEGLSIRDAAALPDDGLMILVHDRRTDTYSLRQVTRGAEAQVITEIQIPGAREVYSLWLASPNALWAATSKGLFRWTDGSWRGISEVTEVLEGLYCGKPEDETHMLCFGQPRGNRSLRTWVASTTQPLPPFKVPHARLMGLDVGPDGTVLAVDDSGTAFIRVGDGGTWNEIDPGPRQLTEVACLRFRTNGDLWAGTGHGLYLYHRATSLWEHWKNPAHGSTNRVHEILKAEDGSAYRAFVCHTVNPWGYPAKDRSGRLDPIEEPHLGRLMAKITGPARPAVERLDFARPTPTEPEQL